MQDFCPDFEVFEVCLSTGKTADDGVCDVADAGLNGKKVDGKSAVVDFVLEKFNQVAGNCSRCVILRSVGGRLVRL